MDAPEQLGFAGFGQAATKRDRPLKRPPGPKGGRCRIFFAQLPTADATAEIARLYASLKSLHGLNGAMLAVTRLHMTLDHIGDFLDFPQATITAACTAASGLVATPFNISLGHVVSFGRNSERLPLVLKESDIVNTELASFRQSLWHALADAGVPGPSRTSFTPHVTLLYDPKAIAEQAVSPVQWTARDFVLLRSFVGETRYEELGSWQFSG